LFSYLFYDLLKIKNFLIAKAMVHSPRILVLDEPTAGVDIELRNQLWEYVKKLNQEQGVTIIITTRSTLQLCVTLIITMIQIWLRILLL
jgi:energy-coupling factor transporter ATP-binding protein EcfA2